jgi:hypothetical protein
MRCGYGSQRCQPQKQTSAEESKKAHDVTDSGSFLPPRRHTHLGLDCSSIGKPGATPGGQKCTGFRWCAPGAQAGIVIEATKSEHPQSARPRAESCLRSLPANPRWKRKSYLIAAVARLLSSAWWLAFGNAATSLVAYLRRHRPGRIWIVGAAIEPGCRRE